MHTGGHGAHVAVSPVLQVGPRCRVAGVATAVGQVGRRATPQGWEVSAVPVTSKGDGDPSCPKGSCPRRAEPTAGTTPVLRPHLCGLGARASWAEHVEVTVVTPSRAVRALDPWGRVQWNLEQLLQTELRSLLIKENAVPPRGRLAPLQTELIERLRRFPVISAATYRLLLLTGLPAPRRSGGEIPAPSRSPA